MSKIIGSAGFAACILAIVAFAAAPADAGIAEWLAEVSAEAGYVNTGISGAAPIVEDIGVYDETTNGGISYEFIVSAGDDGASSAFMGSLSAPVGDSAGLKFEQWPDSGTYGATAFGVADYDSGVAHILNQRSQVVFVNDGTDTALYVNGALAGGIAGFSPTLSGLTGIAQAYNHGNDGTVDPLDGTLLGVAVFDSALSEDEIALHFSLGIPEPSSAMLVVLCAGLLGFRRR